MSDFTLTKTRFREGIWEGRLTANAPGNRQPRIEVTHLEQPLPDVEITENRDEANWLLRIPIPADALGDGVQTFLIRDAGEDETLDVITLISGETLSDDIRSEISLLRAELDMLKRAFRRHCLETM